jgi:hypothetical protein
MAQGPATNAVTIRVTDDGLPPLNDFETISITVNELRQVTFVIARMSESQNAQLAVPILASHFADISSFQFTLRWDPAVAMCLGGEARGVPGINFGTNALASGTMTVLWNNPVGAGTTLAEGTTIFVINLRLIGAPDSATGVFGVGSPLPMSAGSSDSQPVSISVIPGQVNILPATTPVVGITVDAGGMVHLRWDAIPGRRYQVQYATNLPATGWNNLGGELVAANSTASSTDAPGTLRQRFYRVRVVE